MKLLNLVSIFLGIASGLVGLVSFLSVGEKAPAERKRVYIIAGIVFLISLTITGATYFLQNRKYASDAVGIYIANGSKDMKLYFHNDADPATRRAAFINCRTEVWVREVRNGFGYGDFVNTKGQKSQGWLEMKNLEPK